jgi:hypothetical protein
MRIRRPKLSAHQHTVVDKLRRGLTLRAALRRGPEYQIVGMGHYLWHTSNGTLIDQRGVSMDTLISLRGKGVLRLADCGDWSQAILND